MKKIFMLCLLLLCAGSLFADSLVLYFSRADENYGVGYIEKGNAAIVAEMIASKTGSDLFQIVPEKPYPAEYKKCTDIALTEKNQKARPAYVGDVDVSKYDTIYICYPIWWGDFPMTMYTFFEAHDLNGKTLIPFVTHEGSGVSGTDKTLKRLYRNADVKEVLSIRGTTIQKDRKGTEASVDAWLKKVSK